MKVFVKNMGYPLPIKSRGVEIDVGDSSGHLGDLYVTMTSLVWCKGRKLKENGVKLPWADFIRLMENWPKARRLIKKL